MKTLMGFLGDTRITHPAKLLPLISMSSGLMRKQPELMFSDAQTEFIFPTAYNPELLERLNLIDTPDQPYTGPLGELMS